MLGNNGADGDSGATAIAQGVPGDSEEQGDCEKKPVFGSSVQHEVSLLELIIKEVKHIPGVNYPIFANGVMAYDPSQRPGMYIVISGNIGAGKTLAGKYLVENENARKELTGLIKAENKILDFSEIEKLYDEGKFDELKNLSGIVFVQEKPEDNPIFGPMLQEDKDPIHRLLLRPEAQDFFLIGRQRKQDIIRKLGPTVVVVEDRNVEEDSVFAKENIPLSKNEFEIRYAKELREAYDQILGLIPDIKDSAHPLYSKALGIGRALDAVITRGGLADYFYISYLYWAQRYCATQLLKADVILYLDASLKFVSENIQRRLDESPVTVRDGEKYYLTSEGQEYLETIRKGTEELSEPRTRVYGTAFIRYPAMDIHDKIKVDDKGSPYAVDNAYMDNFVRTIGYEFLRAQIASGRIVPTGSQKKE